MRMKTFVLPVSACMLMLWGAAAPVAAESYRVELILFDHLNLDADGELLEHWAAFPTLPADAISLWDGADAETPVHTAAEALPSATALAKEYRSLTWSSEYRPLLQLAWRQPAWRSAPPLWLPEMYCPGATPQESGEQALGGTVRMEDTGRIYFYLDLAVRDCLAEDAPIMRMTARLRILLRRVYYLDHPRIGGLLRVQRESPAEN